MTQGGQTEGEGGRIAEALPRDANVGDMKCWVGC